MPIYEYKCKQCGAKFEIMRGITSSGEEVKCPKCGTRETERLFSAVCGHVPVANRGNLRFPT